MSFFRRNRQTDLEAELRRSRPEPRPEFVAMLAERARGERRRSTRPAFRVVFAGGLTVVMLVALAAFGGLGYAANAVHTAATAVTRVVKPQKPKIVKVSAAADQYGPKKVQVCHKGHTITINRNALPAHLRHGDTVGPCPPRSKKHGAGAFKPNRRGGVKGTSRRGVSPRTTG